MHFTISCQTDYDLLVPWISCRKYCWSLQLHVFQLNRVGSKCRTSNPLKFVILAHLHLQSNLFQNLIYFFDWLLSEKKFWKNIYSANNKLKENFDFTNVDLELYLNMVLIFLSAIFVFAGSPALLSGAKNRHYYLKRLFILTSFDMESLSK